MLNHKIRSKNEVMNVRKKEMNERINFILQTLEPPAGKGLWYGGPTVTGSLRGVSVKQALWKPSKKRHSIWELALHIAYWNYAVRMKLIDGQAGSFPRSPSNWPKVENSAVEKQWNEDKKLVAEEQKLLVEAIRNFDAKKLDRRVPKSTKWTYADLLMGAVTHNTYHTGQIVLMKRLYNSK